MAAAHTAPDERKLRPADVNQLVLPLGEDPPDARDVWNATTHALGRRLPPDLVLPCEMPALPDIHPLSIPRCPSLPPLKAVRLALRISLNRRPFAQHLAQVIEMRLRDGLLRLRNFPPPVNELRSRNPVTQKQLLTPPASLDPPTSCSAPVEDDPPQHSG